MMTALGSPERRFRRIHVLGTNGKSSTTRMTAAILERHGLRTGAYLSPHLVSYRERVLVGEREIDADAFAAAVARAARAAERVNRTLAGDDHVTQFELLTAAALWAMAEREVEVAVVEAGLGGRYDATSVIDAPVTVLTNVGLEHTRWLGPTVQRHRRGEARACSRRAGARARRRPRRRRRSPWPSAWPASGARGSCRPTARRATARLAAARRLPAAQLRARARRRRGLSRDAGIAPREQAVARAAAATTVSRAACRCSSEDPLTVLDGAHNPDAVARADRSLPEAARRAARWRSCSACSRTRTPRACSRALLGRSRARVVHGAARAAARCRRRAAVAGPPARLRRQRFASPSPRVRSRRRRRWARERGGARGARDGLGVPRRRAARAPERRDGGARTEPPRRPIARASGGR